MDKNKQIKLTKVIVILTTLILFVGLLYGFMLRTQTENDTPPNKQPRPIINLITDGGSGILMDDVLTFNASNSFDTDGEITSFSWEFGDLSDIQYGEMVQYSYRNPGNYSVRLSVTDDDNSTANATMEIIVENIPEIIMRQYGNNLTIEEVKYRAVGNDEIEVTFDFIDRQGGGKTLQDFIDVDGDGFLSEGDVFLLSTFEFNLTIYLRYETHSRVTPHNNQELGRQDVNIIHPWNFPSIPNAKVNITLT